MYFIPSRFTVRAAFVFLSLLGSAAAFAQTADLSINESHNPTSAPAGSLFTVTFDVSNSGPDAASDIALAATFASPDSSGTVAMESAIPATANCSFDSTLNTLSCHPGMLSNGTSSAVKATFRLGATAGVWGLAYNVTSSAADGNQNNNSGATAITTTNAADLALTVDPVPDLGGGETFDYVLHVENKGPGTVPANATVVTFAVPGNVQYTGAASGWACSPSNGLVGTAVTCRASAALASGNTHTLTVHAMALGSQVGTTDATFTAKGYNANGNSLTDPDETDNIVIVPVTISQGTDVGIAQSAAISANGQIVFTITPAYRAGDSLENVPITITDTFDSGLFTFDSWVSDPANDGWTCSTPAPAANPPGAPVGSLMEFTCTRGGYNGGKGTNMPAVQFTANSVPGQTSAVNQVRIGLSDRNDPESTNDSANVTINTSGHADLTTSKKASFTPVVIGQSFEYAIHTHNNGPWSVPSGQAITVTDTLPDALVLEEAPTGANWTCSVAQGSTPVGSYPATSTTADPIEVDCVYSSGLPSGGNTPDIILKVHSDSANAALENIACSALQDKGGNPGLREDPDHTNDCMTAGGVMITNEQADLELTKTASMAMVDAGQPLTYTFTITNNGPDDATNVMLDDPLVSLINNGAIQALSIALQPSSGDGVCNIDGTAIDTIATLPMNGTSHIMQCQFPSILASETAIVEITVLPNIAISGNRTNTATVYSADQGDPHRDNNESSADTRIEAVFDLKVTTGASTAMASPATEAPVYSVLTFITHVSSMGPSTAPTAQAVITFPANAEIIQIGSTGGANCTSVPPGTTGGSMTCTWVSGIAAGVGRDITYQVRVPNGIGDAIDHSASVGLIEPGNPRDETSLSNNTASAQVHITPASADVQVTVEDNPDPVLLGQMTQYTIRVKNNGPSMASNIQLDAVYAPDTASFSYAGGLTVDQGGSCSEEPAPGDLLGTIQCTWSMLDVGVEARVTYLLKVDAIHTAGSTTGQINTTATVSSDDDELPGNDTVTEATSAYREQHSNGSSDLSITKTASANSVSPGETFGYTITVHNHGPNAVTTSQGVQMVDSLPATVTLLSIPDGCTHNGSTTVTCLVGDLSKDGDYSVELSVKLDANVAHGQRVTNTAIADLPNGDDPDLGNNEASVTVYVASPVGIATLPQWGLVLLGLLVAFSAVRVRRQGG